MIKRDWTAYCQISSSTLHWIVNTTKRTYVYIQSRNQQTCTLYNHNHWKIHVWIPVFVTSFQSVDLLMQPKSHYLNVIRRSWTSTKHEPKNIHIINLPRIKSHIIALYTNAITGTRSSLWQSAHNLQYFRRRESLSYWSWEPVHEVAVRLARELRAGERGCDLKIN
jgi:hypothetical protein